MRALALSFAMLVAGAVAAPSPQSLGDLAQVEKKKRETKPPSEAASPKKAFTGDDLEAIAATREPTPGAEGGDLEPADASTGSPVGSRSRPRGSLGPRTLSVDRNGASRSRPPDQTDDRPAQEKQWRERKQKAEAALRKAEQDLDKAQAARNYITTGIQRGETYDAFAVRIRATETGLVSAREAHERAKRAFEQLEQEARLAGVPPGWLR